MPRASPRTLVRPDRYSPESRPRLAVRIEPQDLSVRLAHEQAARCVDLRIVEFRGDRPDPLEAAILPALDMGGTTPRTHDANGVRPAHEERLYVAVVLALLGRAQ